MKADLNGRLARAALLTLGGMTAASEAAHYIAGRALPGKPGTSCAVLVLGSPSNGDGSASDEQRLRVDAGIQGATENRCECLILSGGAVHNRYTEADAMADLARSRETAHHFTIVRETAATNTWENVRRSLPLVQSYARILIASDALHAQRGRRYLCKQRPDLCASTSVVGTQRPWWRTPYRLGSSLYELRAWIRDSVVH